MKARIVMIIMAVALIALPAMAQQQEWQSTSAMQGSGSSYSSQVTAVGASEVSDMGTTTTSTPNNGPRRAKKEGETEGSDFGPGGQTGGYQDPGFPIGDAWPLALFAVLFAIVITIKKHKKVMMKKNLKTWLFIAALVMSNGAWADVTMPAGTYYFDLSALTGDNQAWEIEVFNNSESYISFNSLASCNSGVSQGSNAKIYQNTSTGFNQLVLTISTSFSKGGNFLQVRVGPSNGSTSWKGWFEYSAPTAIGGEAVYVCKVTTTGYTWGTTAGDIPSCSGAAASDPILTFAPSTNGTITTATAGGEAVSSGAEVSAGTIVNLVATPDTGYAFYGWSDGAEIVSSSANYAFTMPSSNVTLTALFYVESTDPSIIGCDGCFRVAP